MYYDPGHGKVIAVDGMLIERDVYGVIQKIQEYDENLRVMYVDPAKSDFADAPYVICEVGRDGKMYKVFEAWTMDERVYKRVVEADQARFNALEIIGEYERKAEEAINRRYQDTSEKNRDLIEHVIKSTKSRYSYKDDTTGDKVTIFDDRPTERH
jgi:hypothetical protein